MECIEPIFDLEALEKTEKSCLNCIEEDPADSSARLRLAWCLIIAALYRSGQESVFADQLTLVTYTPDRTAKNLLEEGLLQATIVSDICTDPDLKLEVENLRKIVEICGGGRSLAKANTESNAIFRRLAYLLLGNAGELSRTPTIT